MAIYNPEATIAFPVKVDLSDPKVVELLRGPRGDRGDPGPRGEKVDPGERG